MISLGEKKSFVHLDGEHAGQRSEEVIQPALQFLLNLEKELAAEEAKQEVLSELRGFRGPKIEKMRRDIFDRLLSLKDSPQSSFVETSKIGKEDTKNETGAIDSSRQVEKGQVAEETPDNS